MRMGRPRYQDILTPREWQVLALIEQGLTNQEIAERLDISFGTAKYHVAEIISKTGARSREDAVLIAHRKRRLALPVLSWPLWPGDWSRPAASQTLGLAGAGIAAVGLFVLLATLSGWFQNDGTRAINGWNDRDAAMALRDFASNTGQADGSTLLGGSELESYYFEARIDVDETEPNDVLNTLQGWYEAPDRWRWEISTTDPARAHETVVYAADGTKVWFYEGRTNTVEVHDTETYYAGMPPEMRGLPNPVGMSVLIGPVPQLDAVLTAMGEEQKELGWETVAGVDARVLEMATDDWSLTLWIHPEMPFILKSQTRSSREPTTDGLGPHVATVEPAGMSEVRAEVTQLVLNQAIEAERFSFQMPPGAREVEGSTPQGAVHSRGSTSTGSQQLDVPDGFLRPAYLPNEYIVTGSGSGQSNVGTFRTENRLHLGGGREADTPYLVIQQNWRAGGLAESQRIGQPIDIAGSQGYYEASGDETRLTWARDEIIVVLRADALPLDELIRIAESMR